VNKGIYFSRTFVKKLHLSFQGAKPAFGLLFDIDGVIVRGKKVLPSALDSVRRLVDSEGKFRIPTVFVTNAGNAMRHDKAKQLSSWLQTEVYKCFIIPSSFQYHASKINLKTFDFMDFVHYLVP
jgi:ribonucleotide monophosphatase NagD (HAD superfamily)